MKKRIGIAIVAVAVAAGAAFLFGLFPVARVAGATIWFRTFDGRANALERFEEKSKAIADGKALTEDERLNLRRVVLRNMIAEEVLRRYAEEHFAAGEIIGAADTLVETTLKTADPDLLPRATEELYGWDVDEFRRNVLFPQAFQNVLQERMKKSGEEYVAFVTEELTQADVRLYFVPWRWEGGQLVDK